MNAAVRAVLFGAVLAGAGCAGVLRSEPPASVNSPPAQPVQQKTEYGCARPTRLPAVAAGPRIGITCAGRDAGEALKMSIAYAAHAAVYDGAGWVRIDHEVNQVVQTRRSISFIELWSEEPGAISARDVLTPTVYNAALIATVRAFCDDLTKRPVQTMKDADRKLLNTCGQFARDELVAAQEQAARMAAAEARAAQAEDVRQREHQLRRAELAEAVREMGRQQLIQNAFARQQTITCNPNGGGGLRCTSW